MPNRRRVGFREYNRLKPLPLKQFEAHILRYPLNFPLSLASSRALLKRIVRSPVRSYFFFGGVSGVSGWKGCRTNWIPTLVFGRG